MKLRMNISAARRKAGISLIECLVYITVFVILMGGATTAFYYCWDHTRAVIFTTNEIQSALTAGETWRADIRAATGKISVQTTSAGETVNIPQSGKKVIYRFAEGQLLREEPARNHSRVLLERVKASEITTTDHPGVDAWRWELEIQPRRKETQFPLRFTFEAAQAKP